MCFFLMLGQQQLSTLITERNSILFSFIAAVGAILMMIDYTYKSLGIVRFCLAVFIINFTRLWAK